MSDVIRDSPLPWEARGCRVCANGMPIADFNARGDAAHAAAAANALPGLVELLERHGRMDIDPHGTEAEWSQWRRDVAAALAALPEGVRPC
jgi:hypothetical protein